MAAITVFTPTYNRAYCLHRCYESLCRQSCKDFVWLIIDDGSTDQTKDIVEGWQRAENGFEIVYLYKENGGMHTGYNCAYARIDTELSINVDSDDYLTDTAIEELLAFWREHRREDIGGIYALDRFEDGSTNHMLSQYVRNPKGFCDERKFVLEYAPTLRLRANAAIHYVAESLLAGDWAFFSHTPRKGLTLLCAPMGLALYLWIRRRTKT